MQLSGLSREIICSTSTSFFNNTETSGYHIYISRDTHVVISHALFTFYARLKVCLTIMRPWKGFKGYRDIGQKIKGILDIFVNI